MFFRISYFTFAGIFWVLYVNIYLFIQIWKLNGRARATGEVSKAAAATQASAAYF